MSILEKLKERIIEEEQSVKGLVVECNNFSSFAVVKYTCYNNKYYPKLLLIEDYESLIYYPPEIRLKRLNSFIGTSDFKIRKFAFEKLFIELSDSAQDYEFEGKDDKISCLCY